MNKRKLLLLSILLPVLVFGQKPVPIIFDTDFGPDYDDVGAITLLHAYADLDQATILATIASSRHKNIAAALNVFNTYFGRPSTPIGVVNASGVTLGDSQHWSDSVIARYPHTIKNNQQAEDAVGLYRKVLAAQPDASVTIVTVGFLSNLSHLLQSSADKYSSLPGKELVQKKVKQLVCMAGWFPKGKEFNVRIDSSASKKVFEEWPGKIIFSGFEIGVKIRTGLPLIRSLIVNSPVKDVFTICIPMHADSLGRNSWDQTAVMVAVEGWEKYYALKQGKFICHADGSNEWVEGTGNHFYLTEKMPVPQVQDHINKLMMHQPREMGRK
jgi:inosine-uridine nucleoside N-ribohydrolase